MDENERQKQGEARRRDLLGDDLVQQLDAGRNAFTAEFHDLVMRYAFGEIWTRPHFDDRTRRVLVIGTLIALGRWEEFRGHIRAALTEGGFGSDDIKEIILQQTVYCGIPTANHAFREAQSVIQEFSQR